MEYQHTQFGWLIFYVFMGCIGFFGFVLGVLYIKTGLDYAALMGTAVVLLVLFVLSSFLTLTVTVDKEFLRLRFGWGIFFKKIALKDITSVRRVKNRWFYGWGIRYWFWPRMWIFNLSGYDAVELRMKNGRIFRIGTDEPRKLETAIKRNS